MPYSNMSLQEIARHIGMDAREVKKLADKGVLPGRLIGGEWRFNRMQMLEWLQKDMHTLDRRHIQNLDRAMSKDEREAVISALLATEGVDLKLPARSKPSVIRELVRLAERTGMVYDADGLIAALDEREAIAPTALPQGLAFPHPRHPMPYATAEPMLCLARVPGGIAYGAPDGRMTDLFVLVCCHDERQHLLALARLAQIFHSDLPDAIREAEDAEDALEMILEAERGLLHKRD